MKALVVVVAAIPLVAFIAVVGGKQKANEDAKQKSAWAVMETSSVDYH